MFLPENEHHEIGLLLANYIAREQGWRVYYLGQNVPIKNIKEVINSVSPKAILTMFVTPTKHKIEDSISIILLEVDTAVPLFVSGNPSFFNNITIEKLIYLSNPEELIEELNLLSYTF